MTIKVRYESGVLKPLGDISLTENQVYEVEVMKTGVSEEDAFDALSVREFFEGYGEKDAIYDAL